MRLLDRYILKEMAAAFLLGLMVFTFVLSPIESSAWSS